MHSTSYQLYRCMCARAHVRACMALACTVYVHVVIRVVILVVIHILIQAVLVEKRSSVVVYLQEQDIM